jgi:hypothetical protein
MPDERPVRIELTPEQREAVHRASGQHVDAIELVREESPSMDVDAADETGTRNPRLRFKWRPSVATGIPRQAWIRDTEVPPTPE